LFEGLDFAVLPAEITLLRGPNGAGKTTLLLCLAGLMRPDLGSITFSGHDPEQKPGGDIGFLGHLSAIKTRLTLTENLRFWAAVNDVSPALIEPALEAVGLAPLAGLDAGHLSAGQTRRLALARLILSERPIWLLDEPTAALDAEGDALVAGLIDTHLDRGGLAVAATHYDLALKNPARVKTLALGRRAA
jgi:heme exporter protein A